MLLGANFNNKCKKILLKVYELSQGETSPIEMEEINSGLGFDRTEIRSMCEYMRDKKLIRIESFGGPLLISTISLTPEGVKKCSAIKNTGK